MLKPLADRVLVMFAKYAGSELEIDGATHLIISERDILAVL